MNERKSDKMKLEVLEDAASRIYVEMSRLTSIRENIHAINREKWSEEIRKIKDELGANQMLLFIGSFSSGKSSFINAIIGENILPTNSRPCTSVVTEVHFKNDGRGHIGRGIKKDGTKTEAVIYDYKNLIEMIDGPTGAIGECAAYHHVELDYDVSQTENSTLKILCAAGVTIVDCPGYESPYACNDNIINEYVGKATHVFWMTTVNQFGGRFEINKIKDICGRTTSLIPVFTKSDLKPTAEERTELKDLYYEKIGCLFQRLKTPIFTSANKYKEYKELLKTDSTADGLEKLNQESGVIAFLSTLGDLTEKSEVTDAKVYSCRVQIDELVEVLRKTTEIEQNYWKSKLNQLGWDEGKNVALYNIKKEAEMWIQIESDRAGKILKDTLEEKVRSYLSEKSGKAKTAELQEMFSEVCKNVIDSNKKDWDSELRKIYQDRIKQFNINSDEKIEIPNWFKEPNMQKQITDSVKTITETVKNAGALSTLQGVGGAALLGMAGKVAGVTIGFGKIAIGAALAPVLTIGGGALIGIAAISIVPAFISIKAKNSEVAQYKITHIIEEQLRKFNTSFMIKSLLIEVNNSAFDMLSEETNKKVGENLENYNNCTEILNNLNELHSDLIQQFSSVSN